MVAHKKVQYFTLEKHEGDYETWPIKSQLYFKGIKTNIKIHGYDLLRQIDCGDYYLLITDYDCPFEEHTHVTILNKDLKIVADKGFSWIYNSFLMIDFKILHDHLFFLNFGEDYHVYLQVKYPKKRFYNRIITTTVSRQSY